MAEVFYSCLDCPEHGIKVKEWLEKQPWVTSEDIQVELNSIEETGEGYEEIANKQWIRRDKLLEALSL